MRRHGVMWSVLTVLIVGLGCGGGGDSAPATDPEAAFETLKEQYQATEDPTEKAELAEAYLAQFPETEHTASLADVVVYYRGTELEQWQQAFTTLSEVLDQVEAPATRLELALAQRETAVALDKPFDLAPYVADLEAERALTYTEHTSVMEALAEDGGWAMLEQHADAALGLATIAAYRADYPELEISDAELEQRIAARAATAQAYLGWAMAHTDRAAEALGAFERSAAVAPAGYFGVPDGPLYRFWGETLVENGDAEHGLELLARAHLWADDEAAAEALTARYSLEEPFEEWLWTTRLATARQLDDATLTDADGQEHRITDHLDQVLMLAFWFPT